MRYGPTVKFQSAPPHGGRQGDDEPVPLRKAFQSAPPHGGRRSPHRLSAMPFCPFQSAPPHGGRLVAVTFYPGPNEFQSAPPHGGRRVTGLSRFSPRRRFNPRPRTGGDSRAPRTRREYAFQSAPPHGGRRAGRPPQGRDRPVSIRAPARGATTATAPSSCRAGFNPRPRTGGDPG